MVLDQPTNFARGETTSSIASTDTSFNVANASTFADPATGEYNLVVWDQTQYPRPTASGASPEIVRVAARDTTADTLTVSRGQEGTTAGAFPSGAALIHTQTAKTFGDIDSTFASFWDEQNQELTADINATNGDIDSLSTDILNTVLFASEVGGVQSAIDSASTGDIIIVDGDFSEDVVVDKGVKITSSTPKNRIDGKVTVTKRLVTLEDVDIAGDGSVSLRHEGPECIVRGCRFGNSVEVGEAFDLRFVQNRLTNNDILLESNGGRHVVATNVLVGAITDNSTGSVVTDNT